MSEPNSFSKDERIERIYSLLIKYTTSDFSAREKVSNKGDELDAIIVGLNTLGEELQSSGRMVQRFEERISILMDVLLKYTLMDFSQKIEVTDAGDELDAIAVGLNTLIEELQASKAAEETKAKEILALNTALEANIEQLKTANKELEAFTYSVSHDLRAPLRAIHGFTKIISEDYYDKIDDDGKRMMDSVMRNAKKMGQLIDDLLAFSKVGKKELIISDLDMKGIAMLALQEVKNSFTPFNARVTIENLNPAKGDHNLITLALINLILNAVKYSSKKENPVVTVGSKEKDGKTVYFVKDNGAGFDMLYYDKLFGVFSRLHAATEFDGTGVGLALVKRIINRHGGAIWAEGKLNEGATFYFTMTN